MLTQELTDQVRTEIKRLKEVQDQFLETYKRYCDHFGGPRPASRHRAGRGAGHGREQRRAVRGS